MNVFEAVKQSVTTRQAAERYGIKVNRNGMCVCPFHNDKNPSMKVDRRFYCFGCGATGDMIDFVSRLHGIGSREAPLCWRRTLPSPMRTGETPGRNLSGHDCGRKPKSRNLSAWSGTVSGCCPTITISCAAGRRNTPHASRTKHGTPGLQKPCRT